MKSMVEELWNGNISPDERDTTDKYKRLIREYVECSEQYEPMLSKDVLNLIEKQKEIRMQMESELEKEAFVTGFCLAARLMIDVFQHEKYC